MSLVRKGRVHTKIATSLKRLSNVHIEFSRTKYKRMQFHRWHRNAHSQSKLREF